MAHSGKSIYYAKEFLRIYGEDFTEADLEEYGRISPLGGYSEIGWNGFLEALNYLVMGEDLKTKYKPAWVPDEESARKVADLYGFERKGHVVDPGIYEGLDKYPNGKTTRAAFFRLMGYPYRQGHTYIYSNAANDKHISLVYNYKDNKETKGTIGTYHYYRPYFVFEKKNMAFSGEEVGDDLLFSPGEFLSSTEGAYKQLATEEEPYREKCWLLKAEIDSLDSEIYELETKSGYFNPVKANDHNSEADQEYFRIRGEISRLIKEKEKLEEDYKKALAEWKTFRESKGLDTSSFEAYAVIKTAAPFGAKSFTVVGDKATAARVARIKNKTVENDDKHTYIYRKMDEVNSEKYNIPVNEGVENMKGLVDKLLALGQEMAPANENYANYSVARPNSTRLLEMLGDYLDASSLAEELINWMSDDEVGRFAKENGYFPDEDNFADEEDGDGELDSAEEALPAIATAAITAAASGAGSRLVDKVFEGAEDGLTEKDESITSKLNWVKEPDEENFGEAYDAEANGYSMSIVKTSDDPLEYNLIVDSVDGEELDDLCDLFPTLEAAKARAEEIVKTPYYDEEFEAEESLTEKDKEVLEELPPEQPVEDSQALDEEQGKPVKSATEKKSVYEEYDETEKEMFEAMDRNSITEFQASVSDSISRIGSLGTIQLLLDSELADSFQDELFFIKNTYDLSDTQLVSQAILNAGETLLENSELEQAIETLKNSSEEENEEEFGEYEEPEDWSTVDQPEEEVVETEEVTEEEPVEGEEITEEETELDEENI